MHQSWSQKYAEMFSNTVLRTRQKYSVLMFAGRGIVTFMAARKVYGSHFPEFSGMAVLAEKFWEFPNKDGNQIGHGLHNEKGKGM